MVIIKCYPFLSHVELCYIIYYLLDLLYYIVPVYYNLQGFTQLELHSWQHDTRKKC